jgi:hypothetical protein
LDQEGNDSLNLEKEEVVKRSTELDSQLNDFKNKKKDLENELELIALENDKLNKKIKIY